jgi:1,4-alpha-glucan branching enzyme
MIKTNHIFRLAGLLLLTGLVMPACTYLGPRKQTGGPWVIEEGVRFRFYAPTARYVQLAGDWPENNWARGDGRIGEANVGLMEDPDGDGVWEIVVPLPPGRYFYLFRVDENTWHLDPGNPEEVEGGPAGKCSLILLVNRNNQLEIR